MAERPSVSVLICVRDGERFLAEAIDSVLAQTAPPDEIVVVDDGSSDRSGEIAASYDSVRVVRQAPLGLGAARNRAVAEATGELVAFLDCDNLWDERKLELQLDAFEGDPELDFVFTHAREFATPGEEGGAAVRAEPMPGGLTSSLCARREAIARAGGLRRGREGRPATDLAHPRPRAGPQGAHAARGARAPAGARRQHGPAAAGRGRRLRPDPQGVARPPPRQG